LRASRLATRKRRKLGLCLFGTNTVPYAPSLF
jgi:hypothetical protein